MIFGADFAKWQLRSLALLLALQLALLLALMTGGPAFAAPVYSSGVDRERGAEGRSVGNEGSTGAARSGAAMAAEPRPAGSAASASDSEWARFRKTLRSLLFDQSDDSANARQQTQPARSQPGFSTNITPGAFQVPPTGGGGGSGVPGAANDISDIARNSALELSRQPGAMGGGGLGGLGDATQPGSVGNPQMRGDVAGNGAAAQGMTAQSAPLQGGNPGSGASDGADFPVYKSRETRMLEGMLFSQLMDQAQPWVVGLVALLVFWQLVKGMIHVMQVAQERSLRRKAERSDRAKRKVR